MISFICPVVRPEGFKILEESIKKYCTKYEHEIISEEDTERIGCPKMVKKLVEKAKGDYICYLADDCELLEGTVDIAMTEMKKFKDGIGMIGFNDQNYTKATHWIIHKECIKILEHGEIFNTVYEHNYCDDELTHRVKKQGLYKWVEQAKILHKHPSYGKGHIDEIYEWVLDKDRFQSDRDTFIIRNGKLSVVMIVKNEEKMLKECLESVKEADEIIICDTGSTDRTQEIALEYTTNCHNFRWCDDFSKARNYAKQFATGDWILSIDADEVLESGGIEKIKQHFSTPSDAIGVYMKGGAEYYVPRCFRNVPYIEWTGRIHEIINYYPRENSEAVITYRTSPAHEYDPQRNLRMLEKSYEECPNNTRTLYYLGREYYYYKNWDKAKEILHKYLVIANWLPEIVDAYYLLSQCYWYDGQGNGSIARDMAMKCISINPEFAGAYKLMSTMVYPKYKNKWLELAKLATNEDVLFIH